MHANHNTKSKPLNISISNNDTQVETHQKHENNFAKNPSLISSKNSSIPVCTFFIPIHTLNTAMMSNGPSVYLIIYVMPNVASENFNKSTTSFSSSTKPKLSPSSYFEFQYHATSEYLQQTTAYHSEWK